MTMEVRAAFAQGSEATKQSTLPAFGWRAVVAAGQMSADGSVEVRELDRWVARIPKRLAVPVEIETVVLRNPQRSRHAVLNSRGRNFIPSKFAKGR
jgi:hypothetical protein